jgi:hypothetical protein
MLRESSLSRPRSLPLRKTGTRACEFRSRKTPKGVRFAAAGFR